MFVVAECEGPSMEPTLREGDTFLVNRAAYGARSPVDGRRIWGPTLPAIGDVVVALAPGGEGLVVKRVLGLPGDRIELRDDVVMRNGVAIARREIECDWSRAGEVCAEERVGDRRWRTIRASSAPTETTTAMVVPAGHVYVLGDHRDASYDSRGTRIGLLPLDRVIGRVSVLVSSPFAGRAPARIE